MPWATLVRMMEANPDTGILQTHEDLAGKTAFVTGGGYKSLEENQKVEFEVTQGQKGPQASNVRPVA